MYASASVFARSISSSPAIRNQRSVQQVQTLAECCVHRIPAVSRTSTNVRCPSSRSRGHAVLGRAAPRLMSLNECTPTAADLNPHPLRIAAGPCCRARSRTASCQVGDVALFLPFGCNKRWQRPASPHTRRNQKSADFCYSECTIRQWRATSRKVRLPLLVPPVNRRVVGSSPT